jgi:RHS repeat-associated protein
MTTTIKDPSNDLVPLPMGNAYVYDQLNRIRESRSFTNIDPANFWDNGYTYANEYLNKFTYDANGNILTQKRYNDVGTQIEDLTYNYAKDADGYTIQNRLYHVNDPVSSGAFADDIDDQGTFDNNLNSINLDNNYGYDEIGELNKDSAEEIRHIYWRVDGKVKDVVRKPGSTKKNLHFDYDAMGNRVSEQILDNSNNLLYSDYYVRDGQGNVMAVYRDSNDNMFAQASFRIKEKDIYGNKRTGLDQNSVELIGASAPDTDTYVRILGNKQYEESNHLGNVLAVVSDKKLPHDDDIDGNTDRFSAEILSSNDYSPFGMLLNNRHFSSDKYRYGFNGKEKDDEMHDVEGGWQDYGMRMYDPRICRFPSVDPIAKQYPELTPYQFAGNTPIQATDLDGLEPRHIDPDHEDITLGRNVPLVSGGGLGLPNSMQAFANNVNGALANAGITMIANQVNAKDAQNSQPNMPGNTTLNKRYQVEDARFTPGTRTYGKDIKCKIIIAGTGFQAGDRFVVNYVDARGNAGMKRVKIETSDLTVNANGILTLNKTVYLGEGLVGLNGRVTRANIVQSFVVSNVTNFVGRAVAFTVSLNYEASISGVGQVKMTQKRADRRAEGKNPNGFFKRLFGK